MKLHEIKPKNKTQLNLISKIVQKILFNKNLQQIILTVIILILIFSIIGLIFTMNLLIQLIW